MCMYARMTADRAERNADRGWLAIVDRVNTVNDRNEEYTGVYRDMITRSPFTQIH